MTIRPDSRSGTHFSIRLMHAGDIDTVMTIAAGLAQAPQWGRSAYETALDPNSIPRRVALVAANQQNGALAGFAIAQQVAGQAELESIAVVKIEQRHGIGRELLSTLIDYMKSFGASEFMLEVRASNHRALALYRRLGWIETGRRARYYADPQEDAILMRLPLG